MASRWGRPRTAKLPLGGIYLLYTQDTRIYQSFARGRFAHCTNIDEEHMIARRPVRKSILTLAKETCEETKEQSQTILEGKTRACAVLGFMASSFGPDFKEEDKTS